MIYKIEETEITIKNANNVYQAVLVHMSLIDNIIIDLSLVNRVDTSGIAVMMTWWQYAKQHNIKCEFEVSDEVRNRVMSYRLTLPLK